MAIQTATTGDLEQAQNIVIAAWRYTAENNAPCFNLIDHFTLGAGEKQYTFPKVGQATFLGLVDGVDMVDSQDIGLTYVTATPSEVGAKFILTDKLVRQASEDAFTVIGRQLGDGFTRKREGDIITLFASLDYAWGADNAPLGMTQASGIVTLAAVYNFMPPIFVIHHPNAMGTLTKSNVGMLTNLGAVPSTAVAVSAITSQQQVSKLANFFVMSLNGATFYQTAAIPKIGATDSGYGTIASKGAMAIVESKAPYTARERDESLRATEVVMISDYIAVEVDGLMGASARYEIGNIRTT